MKRILTIALAVLMIVSVTAVFASAHENGKNLGTVPVASATPVIDGQMDAAYNNSLAVAIDAQLGAIYNLNTDDFATGEAYLLVSSDYKTLYIYGVVTDNNLVFGLPVINSDLTEEVTPNSAWTRDSIEVFIDPTNAHTVTITTDEDGYPVYNADERNTGLFQYRVDMETGTKTSWGNGATNERYLNEKFEGARKILNGNQYAFEFAIDIETLAGYTNADCCKENAKIGFQMMINDMVPETNIGSNILSSTGDGECSLQFYGTNANSPSVWASQDWNYIVLGNTQTVGVKPTPVTEDPGAAKKANNTADTLAVSAIVLVLAAAGAVVATKKRR